MNSFILPLIEETHCDLSSSLIGVSRAPFCEVTKVETFRKYFKPPKDLFYLIKLKSSTSPYEPKHGDLIMITNIRPQSVDDLNRPGSYYNITHVRGSKHPFTDKVSVLSSKCIEVSDLRSNHNKLYAIYLMNLTTNFRIWKALNSQQKGGNMNIIKRVLQPDSNVRVSSSFVHSVFPLSNITLHFNLYSIIVHASAYET